MTPGNIVNQTFVWARPGLAQLSLKTHQSYAIILWLNQP